MCHRCYAEPYRLGCIQLYMRYLYMSALLPEALQQLRLLTLRDLEAKQQVRIDLPMGTLTATELMHMRNVSTARVLLQIPEDMVYYHRWTHNSTRDTETEDNSLIPILLASMTAVCTMLLTIMFIWRLYTCNSQKKTVTPSAVIMISSTDELHQKEQNTRK